PLLIWWTPLCLIRQILTRRFRLYAYTYFTGSAANKVFHTLTVDKLTTNGTAYAMRTDLKNADKL
ncbi:hypothetical protein RNP68_23530, partial [Escherichia coli]|nr:hypothetical protein [Escherichia coli]